MTDARLHSTKPIDDEIPFADATEVPRDEAPEDENALVTPAAAERDRMSPDPDIEPSQRPSDAADQGDVTGR